MDHGYQTKTVRRIIRKKMEKWLESLPEELRELAADSVLCTGGAPASMLIGEDVNDFDFYFSTREACEAVARYYVARFLEFHPDASIKPEVRIEGDRVRIHIQSAGVASEHGDEHYRYFEAQPEDMAESFVDALLGDKPKDEKPKDDKPFRPRFLSENAITCSDKVQIVIRFWGTLDKIHENYDFDHCKCGYDYAGNLLYLPAMALTSLLSRTIRYSGSLYPLCSLFRLRKFLQRGWHVSAGEILKIALQVSALDLSNIVTLREQLVGVDMAYFYELLALIDAEKNKRAGKPLDAAYLTLLIDQIFNT